MQSQSAIKITEDALKSGIFDMDDGLKKTYRYWRIRIMYATIIGYATFYLVRMNFAMVMPTLADTYGYTKTQLGIIITIFSIIYGVGKFVNGFLSDRSNARNFMTVALLGSALVNFLMGFGESLLYFGVLWGVNAWFQSMAWPPVARLLTHWYCPKELGTKWGFWNSSHQIGGASIFILAGFLIANYGWESAFYVPGIVAVVISFFLFNRLRDTPKAMGLPPVEVYRGTAIIEEEEDNLSRKEIIKRVLANKLLWYLCFGNMFLYTVRLGVFNWAPTFLQEMKGSEMLTSGWQSAGFEVAGLFGGIFAGFLSDKVFHGRRGPVSVLYMVALVGCLIYFWQVPAGFPMLDAAAMFAVGFFVYGPQVLVGVAAADFASKKAAGMATGLTGTFGYLGGAISGWGIGYIADTWGWGGGFMFFIISAMLGVFFFSLTWRFRSAVLDAERKKQKAAKAERKEKKRAAQPAPA